MLVLVISAFSLIIAIIFKRFVILLSRTNFLQQYMFRKYYSYCNDLIDNMNGFHISLKNRKILKFNENFKIQISNFFPIKKFKPQDCDNVQIIDSEQQDCQTEINLPSSKFSKSNAFNKKDLKKNNRKNIFGCFKKYSSSYINRIKNYKNNFDDKTKLELIQENNMIEFLNSLKIKSLENQITNKISEIINITNLLDLSYHLEKSSIIYDLNENISSNNSARNWNFSKHISNPDNNININKKSENATLNHEVFTLHNKSEVNFLNNFNNNPTEIVKQNDNTAKIHNQNNNPKVSIKSGIRTYYNESNNKKFILLGLFYYEKEKKFFEVYFRKLTEYDDILDFLIYDVTKLKEAEHIKAENNLKSNFFMKIAHEFKTPLNSILGIIANIKIELKNLNLNTKIKKDLAHVKNLSAYTTFLINDIIEYSCNNIKSFGYKLKNEKLDLKEIIQFCQNILETLLITKGKENSIKVVIEHDELIDLNKIYIYSDNFRIKQILLNFISNSVKFTKTGIIKLSTKVIFNHETFKIGDVVNNYKASHLDNTISKNISNIQIAVSDSGIGIKTEDLNNLFKEKIKLNYRDYNNEGSGLGLSIVKYISNALNHEILVNSEYGSGSEFILQISSSNIEDRDENELLSASIDDIKKLKIKKYYSYEYLEKSDVEIFISNNIIKNEINGNNIVTTYSNKVASNYNFSGFSNSTKELDSLNLKFHYNTDNENYFNTLISDKKTFCYNYKCNCHSDHEDAKEIKLNLSEIRKANYNKNFTYIKNIRNVCENSIINKVSKKNRKEKIYSTSNYNIYSLININNPKSHSSFNLGIIGDKNVTFEKRGEHDHIESNKTKDMRNKINDKVESKIIKNKILIVDDHKFILDSLKNIIQISLKYLNLENNFEVIEGRDGVDLLSYVIYDQINDNLIKCVITDENMEYINGSEAIEILRKLENSNKIKKILIVSLTAFVDDYNKNKIKNSGADYIFSKPCNQNIISNFIKENLLVTKYYRDERL